MQQGHDSMDMGQGHAALTWTCGTEYSMKMQHVHISWTRCVDVQHGEADIRLDLTFDM
jgi:hypothetical protein